MSVGLGGSLLVILVFFAALVSFLAVAVLAESTLQPKPARQRAEAPGAHRRT
jgi:hypothetical protein